MTKKHHFFIILDWPEVNVLSVWASQVERLKNSFIFNVFDEDGFSDSVFLIPCSIVKKIEDNNAKVVVDLEEEGQIYEV